MFAAPPQYARDVIKAFNQMGFDALNPEWSGGRPKRIGPAVAEHICRIAKTPPARAGLPFTTWSLTKLREFLSASGNVTVSTETIRQILRKAGISWQATKTWKGSKDPDFAEKMARVLDLYDHPPADGRVICVDEFGPLNLQPRPGKGWFPGRQARRLRATYTRTGGVRHMFGGLDLASGQMFFRFRDRKRWQEFLDFCRQLRARFPTGKLYLVVDNFSPHKKDKVTDWCEQNNVELVFTPSNASWLNRIEAEFTHLRYFTLNGSDYPSRAAPQHLQRPPRPSHRRLRAGVAEPQRGLADPDAVGAHGVRIAQRAQERIGRRAHGERRPPVGNTTSSATPTPCRR